MEGIAEAEDGKNGCRRAGEPLSMPGWVVRDSGHGSDSALPSRQQSTAHDLFHCHPERRERVPE